MTDRGEVVRDAPEGTDSAALPTRTDDPSFDSEEEPPASIDATVLGDPAETPDLARRKSYGNDEVRPLTLPSPGLNIARVEDRRLLELAIESSPDPDTPGRHLPSTRFAETVALCNDRTMRRYEAGGRSLPALLREKLMKRVLLAQKIAAEFNPDSPLAAWKAVDKAFERADL